MDEIPLKLKTCPIVEAVIDIRCDLPPSSKLEDLETAARETYQQSYPKFRKIHVEEHTVEARIGESPQISTRQGFQGFQFLTADQKQLVQVRRQGYTFNRLAPYTTLDDYLLEIERSWRLFLELTSPVLIREIHLRFINRLLLPLTNGRLEFNDYLKVGPRLPDEENLELTGFLDQHTAKEPGTGHQVNLILTMQPAPIKDHLAVILDIEVFSSEPLESLDWGLVCSRIQALRVLKNRMFRNTLTEKCLNLYSQ